MVPAYFQKEVALFSGKNELGLTRLQKLTVKKVKRQKKQTKTAAHADAHLNPICPADLIVSFQ